MMPLRGYQQYVLYFRSLYIYMRTVTIFGQQRILYNNTSHASNRHLFAWKWAQSQLETKRMKKNKIYCSNWPFENSIIFVKVYRYAEILSKNNILSFYFCSFFGDNSNTKKSAHYYQQMKATTKIKWR